MNTIYTKEVIEHQIRSKIDGRFQSDSTTDYYKESRIPRMHFGDLSISIQASDFHYCTPRENTDYYESVELGYPNFTPSEEFIGLYAEDKDTPQDTVYGYVPIKALVDELFLQLNGSV